MARSVADEPKSTLVPRVVSALVLAPPVLWAVWSGGVAFQILISLAALIAVFEWMRMAGRAKLWVIAGGLYIALAIYALWWLRLDPQWGRVNLIWLMAVVWATDIGGYVFGRTLGGAKLAPSISPNKTWSGFIGGMALAVSASFAVLVIFELDAGWGVALLAGVISAISQGGDLLESAMKRRFQVKDSGNLIPGHGGMLDRVDGLMAASTALALINMGMGSNFILWLA
ncbi:MAG: phosphatidate cytidylyltransferase [Rhodospirillaceae bacterium]|nr:phosphatidate cytidylyltransferase [Rhodospirillaceae bacterium]